jgi:hypothetical protein
MPPSTTLLSDAAGLLIAALYTVAGQAHFTDRFTPGLASHIETMTRNSYAAFWFLSLDYLSVSHTLILYPCQVGSKAARSHNRKGVRLTVSKLKRTFGAFDLIAAVLLWRRQTRKFGLVAAIVGFSGGIYGQLYSGGDIGQVSAMLGLALLGLLFAP